MASSLLAAFQGQFISENKWGKQWVIYMEEDSPQNDGYSYFNVSLHSLISNDVSEAELPCRIK